MIYIRKAQERGYSHRGWLKTWFTFSFADYYDPNFMGFSALRVMNEDIIAPGEGFGTHPHENMEILTYVVSGAIEHQDSMGNKEQIPAGEFQIMSAGTGVRHSEYNPNKNEPLHSYQIWIMPNQQNIEPRYEQRKFPDQPGRQFILTPDAREGSLKVYQDMTLSRWIGKAGQNERLVIDSDRKLWIQVIKGEVIVNQQTVVTSDAVALWDESVVTLAASKDSEVLIFDLPPV